MRSYPQSLKDGDHRRHHAEFTVAGRAKLKANQQYHQDSELLPGIDYCVKQEPDSWWLPFRDIPSTQHFRHTWIIEKRRLSVAPLFIGSPAPMQRDDSSERSALLTMSYFHPWALRQQDAEGDHRPGTTHHEDQDHCSSREEILCLDRRIHPCFSVYLPTDVDLQAGIRRIRPQHCPQKMLLNLRRLIMF